MDSHLYRKPAPALEELPLFASDRPAVVETAAPADDTPWYEGAIAALDFETTGVDPFTCRPVSVAFHCDDPEGETGVFPYSAIIDCDVEVPAAVAEIHGITTERVRAEGVAVKVAAHNLCRGLAECASSGIPVVIMNVRYDWTLLRAELDRCGRAFPEGVTLIDPIIIDQKFDKYRKGKRRLGDLCRTYGLPALDDAHDAMADARAAIGVTRAMARKYLSSVPLTDLAMLQAQWFETFRVSRNAYWKSQGDERFMESGWPLLDRNEP